MSSPAGSVLSRHPTIPLLSVPRHLVLTLRLALPVVVARAGMVIMLTVATLFTSRVGAADIAFLGLAMAPQIVLTLVAIGTLSSVSVLTAQATGANEWTETGLICRVGLGFGLVVGVVLALVCFVVGPALALIGEPLDLAAGAGRVSDVLAVGLPPLLIYVATSLFLEGLGRPRPAMAAMLIGNIVNLLLCWRLVPGLGAVGAAYAMTAARFAMGLSLLGYVLLLMPDRKLLGLDCLSMSRSAARQIAAKITRLGLPLGLAQGVESSAFSFFVFMAGYLGEQALAAYNILMNVVTLVFMMAIGLSSATAVRVGQAVGRGDGANMRRAGWVGVGLILPPTALTAVLLGSHAEAVLGFYTDDAQVLTLAATALVVACGAFVFDGCQGVTMGGLRGLGDIWVPTVLQCLSFWVVAVPVAALSAFAWHLGVSGLFCGILGGTMTAATLLTIRFRLVSRRAVSRV